MADDKFIRALTGPSAPSPLDRLADYWVKRNLSAIAAIAMASMMNPPGTAYDLSPLRIVGFQTGDARILYQIRLHNMAKAQRHTPVVEYAIRRHIEDLALFCRAEFLKALLTLDVQAAFQRDAFAREDR
jgi:hypothetical protein